MRQNVAQDRRDGGIPVPTTEYPLARVASTTCAARNPDAPVMRMSDFGVAIGEEDGRCVVGKMKRQSVIRVV